MQCPNVLRDGSPPPLPESRKRKWDDLQSQLKVIEGLYNIKVGSSLTAAEFDSRALNVIQHTFHKGDLAIVQRSDKSHQYVMILQQEGDRLRYHDAYRSYHKAACCFYAVNRIEEELPATVPVTFDDEGQNSASFPDTLNCQVGPRTLEADNFFQELSCARPAGIRLSIGGNNFYPISSKTQGFATKRLASCGSIPRREILLLDPHNSPLLNGHFEALKLEVLEIQKRVGALYPDQVLRLVKLHLRSRIFHGSSDQQLRKVDKIFREALQDSTVVKVAHDKFPGEMIPAISIEKFIADGAGVCRHTSLAACYLLDRLTKEPFAKPLLEGSVQHIRDNIPLGGHSWAVFIPRAKPHEAPQRWLLDAQFDVLENFAIPEGRARLSPYGDALNRMIERTDHTAQLNGQPFQAVSKPPSCD